MGEHASSSQGGKDEPVSSPGQYRRRELLLNVAGLSAIGAAVGVDALLTPLEGVAAATPTRGGTIVYARDGDADSLDPMKTTTTLSWQVHGQLYDTLLAFDAQGRVQPNVAKSWTVSKDGKSVTFVLREGVTFHDGTPLDAAAVKFSLDRAVNPATANPSKAGFGPLVGTEVTGKYTVRLEFSDVFVPVLSMLADPFSGIVSPTGVRKYGDGFGSHPIGSGPFMFKEWVKGDHITLVRNPRYRGFSPIYQNKGPVYVDSLIFRVMPEAQTRLAALETGEINFGQPPIEQVKALQANPKYSVYIANRTGQLVFFEFVVHRPPFDDERVRKAVGYGVNVPQIINIALPGLVQPETCAVASGIAGNDEAFCSRVGFHYDPQRAKQLLQGAGYADKRLPVTLMTWTGDGRDRVAQVIQSQLRQIGIDISIQMMDIGTLNARVKQEQSIKTGPGVFDMMGWAWFDPDILYALWHTPGWVNGYHDPTLDKMLEAQRRMTDPAGRLREVKQIEQYILAHGIMVPLYTPGWNWVLAARKEIQGFKFAPFNRATFNDVYISKS